MFYLHEFHILIMFPSYNYHLHKHLMTPFKTPRLLLSADNSVLHAQLALRYQNDIILATQKFFSYSDSK